VQGASNNNKLENGLIKVVHVPKKSMFIPAQGSIPTKVSGMVLVDWAFPTQTHESIEKDLLGPTHKQKFAVTDLVLSDARVMKKMKYPMLGSTADPSNKK
jgi:hypothetical protein